MATRTSTCVKAVPAAVDLASRLAFTAVPGTSSCSTRMVCAASSRVGLRTSARGPLPLRDALPRIASIMTAQAGDKDPRHDATSRVAATIGWRGFSYLPVMRTAVFRSGRQGKAPALACTGGCGRILKCADSCTCAGVETARTWE